MFNEVNKFSVVIRPAAVVEVGHRYTCEDNAHYRQYECDSQGECRYSIMSFLVCTVIMKRKANEHDERSHGEDIKRLNQGLDIFFRRTVNEVKFCKRCLRESFKPIANFRETHPKISRDARFVQAVVVCAIEIEPPAVKSFTLDGEE